MNDIITIKGVRGYLDATGTAQLNLEDVSRGLGFTQEKSGIEYPTYNTVDEVPAYWREDIRQLVEQGIISGVGGGKLGLTHSDCKAAVIAKRIREKL